MPFQSSHASSADAALSEVKAVYQDLSTSAIHRNCTLVGECCQFKLTGKIPHLTRGEALFAAKALRASGRKKVPESPSGACPLLNPATSRCMVYESRPFGCRTHFCNAAGGPYSRKEVTDLVHRLEAVDALLGGGGPRSLPGALEEGMLDFEAARR